ncbi:MAG TPA: energy-coupling factor transporter ATPase [Candidatus Methanoculleus thermohydrogenotrophicum]|mgnify:CR=1 FL=1|jgi:energy-coupling factor transport system ATP-binding protein|nr:energy-coupling factor transporter ATPase [Candidatus Methanoculleus thermohydrogenotrophicum]NLM81860.1 ABC transporter ATP-binding protein [Candidatus Methanoculleus thermohydrogenotrophicum]HOB18477.1 energy-coupling factor transporter ATPase [Candidatus Methanoculleus thermohydrogenotrophicum]HPZ38591.1 energy-coupling factor transporter ATPase [Candidatus Methanoculleus thermohydrogenotrophicum]HQC91733.1 energy-coupling factor transporter ATPase [Candidatus Methanoculleus thermohydroge
MTPETVLSLAGVSYAYPGSESPALDGINLDIRRGEIVFVTGPTGAGKTTLCLAASGILHHDYGGRLEGRITILGKDVRDYPGMASIGRHVGVVFDDADAQLIFSTVEEEVASGLENLGLPRDEMRQRLSHVMEATGIAHLADRAPHTLSGGQKQRVAIAATLILGTEILILDEPTAELDAEATATVSALLRRLSEEGTAVLIVEQKLDDLAGIADRVILIEGGVITREGTPGEVLQHPGDGGIRPTSPPRRSAAAPIISIRGLIHRYDGVTALAGVDLDVAPGEIVAVVGENGSGKTTLVKHLNGLLRPTAGSVFVDGLDAAAEPVAILARHAGLVFQNPDTMLFADTVEEEVAFGLRNIDPGGPRHQVDAALREVGLLHRKAAYPRSLSRGEQQRLAIACVVAMRPRVIVLDEPTTGLDARESAEVMAIIGRLRQAGHTIVMVSHDMRLVENYADRIVRMEAGRIVPD